MQGLAGLMNRHHERMGGCGGSALLRRYHRYSTSAVHVLDQQVTIPSNRSSTNAPALASRPMEIEGGELILRPGEQWRNKLDPEDRSSAPGAVRE